MTLPTEHSARHAEQNKSTSDDYAGGDEATANAMPLDSSKSEASPIPAQQADRAGGSMLGANEALPEMFAEFEKATAALMQSHDALLAQVNSLKNELADKNKLLERKKRLEALGRVAAGVAHEFRNPLGSIQLFAEALDKAVEDPSKTAKCHELTGHILEAVEHLDHIVVDLLSFTRMQSVNKDSYSIAELVQHAQRLALPIPSEQNISLELVGPSEQEVFADKSAITQVLCNLIQNASQALSPAGGKIRIRWGQVEDWDWIILSDNGTGIPAEEAERIFLPFHTLRVGGTGLGLAIVQSRVEAHGGEISLLPTSESEDLPGANFKIRIPKEAGGVTS